MLIDMSMVMHRCYAKMDFLKNSEGDPTGMEFGSLRIIQSLKTKFPDQKIVLCLDSRKSWRKEKYKTYKADRVTPSDRSYRSRINTLLKFLREEYNTAEAEGYEADDVMYSLSLLPGIHYIYSNDHDLLQAVTDRCTVLKSFKSVLYHWDIDKVVETYGVPPKLLTKYFAFTGDRIDAVAGVPRISKKHLAELLVWADAVNRNGVDEVCTADWPINMKMKIHDYVNSGEYAKSYELIKLCDLNKVAEFDNVKWCNEPRGDVGFVKECLQQWNIYSLSLSKKYQVVGTEEF